MKVDLVDSVSRNIRWFRLLGHWPVGDSKVYNAYGKIVTLTVHLYNLTGILYVLMNEATLTEMAATIYNLLNTTAAGIKLNFFRENFTQLNDIVNMLKIPEFQSDINTKILKKNVFKSKVIYYYFIIMIHCAVLQWWMFPFLDKQKRLPSNAWFPYDFLSSGYFAPTYIWQCIGIYCVAFSNCCIDTFFPAIMLQIESQCDILGDSVSRLGDSLEEGCHEEYLYMCIKQHKLILGYAEQVREAYKNIIFTQYLATCFVLCETMFLLTLTPPFSANFYWLLTYQGTILAELMFFCWFGNEVIVKSDKLDYCAFSSKWYDMSESFKKDLLFFLQNLQKPITLWVGRIFPVRLTTSSSIIRASWTYFMALNNLHKA